MLREYMGRRILQRVERVMKRSMGKRTPFLAPHCLSQSTLGSLLGAARQSVEFVIWPWQNVCGYHLFFYFILFFHSNHSYFCLFLLMFSWLWHYDLCQGSHGSLSSPSNVLTILFLLIFLLITLYFQGMIQSKCIGSQDIFSTEFGVVALSGSNPEWKTREETPYSEWSQPLMRLPLLSYCWLLIFSALLFLDSQFWSREYSTWSSPWVVGRVGRWQETMQG